MRLRTLRLEDAPRMLEWMHDRDVVKYMTEDFAGKTLMDCERFIQSSGDTDHHLHLAMAAEDDAYMGTVSLKHIDAEEKTAEFAIVVCSDAMGKDFAAYGMRELLRIGLEDKGLRAIYWCAPRENQRALRFYEKNRYHRIPAAPAALSSRYPAPQAASLIWYAVYSHSKGNVSPQTATPQMPHAIASDI